MNKLQIFSKYLPYGAKMKVTNILDGKVENYIVDLKPQKLHDGLMEDFILLLRPLESLTEEEWLGVFKAGMKNEKQKASVIIYNMGVSDHVRFSIDSKDGAAMVYFHHEFRILKWGDAITPLADLPIIESLYALHVDIHGAIGLGFAVDKTKIQL